MDGVITLLTHGGHPRRQTCQHGRVLSTATPVSEREEGGKGKKRKKKGGEVATGRWGRAVSGTGAGCAGRRVGWAAAGPKEEGELSGWLRPIKGG
jgi:hypothetical protein